MNKLWAADFELLLVEGGEPSELGKALVSCEQPDHSDSRPSCLVDLVHFNFYCFGCGASGSLDDLVELTGGKVSGRYQDFKEQSSQDSREWEELLQLPLAFDDGYLKGRGVEDWQIDFWKIRSNESWVVFPLDDRFGRTIGLKVRQKSKSGKSKYLTFGSMPDYIKTPDWQLESARFTNTVVATEGIFGLLRLQKLDQPAITPLSAGRALRLEQVMKVSNHDFYLAFDPDVAGYMAATKLLYRLRAEPNVWSFYEFFEIDEVEGWEQMPRWGDVVDASWYTYYLEEMESRYGSEIAKKQTAGFKRWARFN